MKIRNSLAVAVLFLASHLSAQTADDLIATGRGYLPTNLPAAYASFNSALTLAPSNQTANALAAATRILILPGQTPANNFLNRLGVSGAGRDILNWTADFARNPDGNPILPSNLNSSEAIALYKSALMPAIDASLANLSRITDTNFTLTLSSTETSVAAVTLDYGDVMLLRSLLHAADFLGHTLNAHNFSVVINRIAELGSTDQLTIQRLLTEYPKLLAASSKTDLLASESALTNAIACYFAASDFIRNTRTPGVERLFDLPEDELANEASFRENLATALESLDHAVRLNPDSENLASIFAGAYFDGTKALRSLLPRFDGNRYINGSLPDYTFGGVLVDFPACDVEQALRNGLGFPYAGIYVVQMSDGFNFGGAVAVLVATNQQASVVGFDTFNSEGIFEQFPINKGGFWNFETNGVYRWGEIYRDGSVQGGVYSTNGSATLLEGERVSDLGPFQKQAGFYAGTWSGGGESGKLCGILTAAGDLFYRSAPSGGGSGGGGRGELDSANKFTSTDVGGTQIAGTLSPATLKITGTFNSLDGASGTWTISRSGSVPTEMPPTITTAPVAQTRTAGSAATFNVLAAGSPPLSYQWYSNGIALSKCSAASLVLSNVSAASVGTYSVEVRNLAGSTNAWATLNVVPETVPPKLNLTAPLTGQRVSNAVFTVTGTASDNAGVSNVWFKLNAGDWAQATGTTSWSANAALQPGTNVVRAFAQDTSGNFSTTNSATFVYVLSDRLTLLISGAGTVTPNYSNQLLELDKSYTMTAMPAGGWLFSNWLGTDALTSKLTFVMRSNLVFQANFVTNPFIATKGTYNGLFFETNTVTGVLHERSGFFTLTLLDKGTYSGSLLMGRGRYPLKGQFDVAGTATAVVSSPASGPLTANLQLDLMPGADQLSGTVTASNWTAQLTADRVVFGKTKPATLFAGKYTMIIPGRNDDAALPEGDSYGTVVVDSAGGISLLGMLADGTALAQKTTISKNGDWPLYAPLYGGVGSLLSWITITNGDLSGAHVSWIKPAQAQAKFYPSGFTNDEFFALGSAYRSSATNRVIAVTNGIVLFTGGNLPASITNDVTLSPANKVTGTNVNKLAFTIVQPSGLFSGTITVPGATRGVPFKGALLQDGSFGSGYFLGTNRSGRVWFGPDSGPFYPE